MENQKPQLKWKWDGRANDRTGKRCTRGKFNRIKFGSWPIKTIKTLKLGKKKYGRLCAALILLRCTFFFFFITWSTSEQMKNEVGKRKMRRMRSRVSLHYYESVGWLCRCALVFSIYFYTHTHTTHISFSLSHSVLIVRQADLSVLNHSESNECAARERESKSTSATLEWQIIMHNKPR